MSIVEASDVTRGQRGVKHCSGIAIDAPVPEIVVNSSVHCHGARLDGERTQSSYTSGCAVIVVVVAIANP